MGIESFDSEVIKANALTCTPQVLMRAVANVNEAGAHAGPRRPARLLPGLNLIYGLPGETHRTHYENLAGLARILDEGCRCHRINVRQARAYQGTPWPPWAKGTAAVGGAFRDLEGRRLLCIRPRDEKAGIPGRAQRSPACTRSS